MRVTGQLRMLRKKVLPKLASLFQQLSLFDGEETLIAKPEIKPSHSRLTFSTPLTQDAEDFQSLCRGEFAHIEVQLKPKLWDSWRATWSARKDALRLEVPALLAHAPLAIKQNLLRWAVLVTHRNIKKKPELKTERRRLEEEIRTYLQTPSDTLGPKLAARLSARNKRRMERLKPLGRIHDLAASFQRVNAAYFNNTLKASVTWSARLGGLSTHTLVKDAANKPYHLISISRGYDCTEVTEEILDGVMYHECLHAAIPPIVQNGRRVVHGPEFKRRERAYPFYRIWRDWHREGLPKSLRRMRRSGG